MKKSFLFVVLFLCGCVSAPQYATVEKQQEADVYFFENLNFLPMGYYTKENIIKAFGEPEVEIKTGKFETLKYIVPDDSGNTLKYAFILENGTLKTIDYEDFIVGTQFGAIEGDFKPWISMKCEQEEKGECVEDKLLKIYSIKTFSQSKNKVVSETNITLKDDFSSKMSLEEKQKQVDMFYQRSTKMEKIATYQGQEKSCSLFSLKAENRDRAMAVCVVEKENSLKIYEVFANKNAEIEVVGMLK